MLITMCLGNVVDKSHKCQKTSINSDLTTKCTTDVTRFSGNPENDY